MNIITENRTSAPQVTTRAMNIQSTQRGAFPISTSCKYVQNPPKWVHNHYLVAFLAYLHILSMSCMVAVSVAVCKG